MLGHRNLKTTQQYARVVDRKLSDDMQRLQTKFNKKTSSQGGSPTDEAPL
jgi:hypothetical protein